MIECVGAQLLFSSEAALHLGNVRLVVEFVLKIMLTNF